MLRISICVISLAMSALDTVSLAALLLEDDHLVALSVLENRPFHVRPGHQRIPDNDLLFVSEKEHAVQT